MELSTIKELLANHEPKWKTHQQSIWNRVRREIEALNGNIISEALNGNIISEALSWNPDTKEWEL